MDLPTSVIRCFTTFIGEKLVELENGHCHFSEDLARADEIVAQSKAIGQYDEICRNIEAFCQAGVFTPSQTGLPIMNGDAIRALDQEGQNQFKATLIKLALPSDLGREKNARVAHWVSEWLTGGKIQ